MPSDAMRYMGSHRGISENTLNDFECFLSGHSRFEEGIVFQLGILEVKLLHLIIVRNLQHKYQSICLNLLVQYFLCIQQKLLQ